LPVSAMYSVLQGPGPRVSPQNPHRLVEERALGSAARVADTPGLPPALQPTPTGSSHWANLSCCQGFARMSPAFDSHIDMPPLPPPPSFFPPPPTHTQAC
jgi:hypothetical protein